MLCKPWPWSIITVPPVKYMSASASETTPLAIAPTGVPGGAAMSRPRCGARGAPFRMRWLP